MKLSNGNAHKKYKRGGSNPTPKVGKLTRREKRQEKKARRG